MIVMCWESIYGKTLTLKDKEITEDSNFHVVNLNVDANLKLFFESVKIYLFQEQAPSDQLLKLKFKELILQILTNSNNLRLRSYFLSILQDGDRRIEPVIRKNLYFNLSMEDYANLCNRSLSAFKRDFKVEFGL